MTQDITGNMTQMMWRPKLIRVTQIGVPWVNGGKDTALFLNPEDIVAVGAARLKLEAFEREPERFVECTFVSTRHTSYNVTESPEKIASLRDASLGFEPEKPTLSSIK